MRPIQYLRQIYLLVYSLDSTLPISRITPWQILLKTKSSMLSFLRVGKRYTDQCTQLEQRLIDMAVNWKIATTLDLRARSQAKVILHRLSVLPAHYSPWKATMRIVPRSHIGHQQSPEPWVGNSGLVLPSQRPVKIRRLLYTKRLCCWTTRIA